MEKDKLKALALKILNFTTAIFKTFFVKLSKIDVDKNNFRQRVISSIILLPFAVYAIFFSKNLFIFIAVAASIIMTIEWLDMVKKTNDEKIWRIIGFFYISIPIYCVIRLRLLDSDILFWMFAIIWVTDIFAYFAGKMIGGKKLAPSISPGKTWAGLYGGIIASAIIGFISSFMFTGSALFFILVSIFLSLIEQSSDLLESKFKRIFGVKDSGNIIPGHGGLLDRLDGMMLTAPALLFVIKAFPDQFGF